MRKLIIVCLVLNTVCLSLRGEETVKKKFQLVPLRNVGFDFIAGQSQQLVGGR
nr:hypothetical protein [Odoribacter sp. OF09-27XD]